MENILSGVKAVDSSFETIKHQQQQKQADGTIH